MTVSRRRPIIGIGEFEVDGLIGAESRTDRSFWRRPPTGLTGIPDCGGRAGRRADGCDGPVLGPVLGRGGPRFVRLHIVATCDAGRRDPGRALHAWRLPRVIGSLLIGGRFGRNRPAMRGGRPGTIEYPDTMKSERLVGLGRAKRHLGRLLAGHQLDRNAPPESIFTNPASPVQTAVRFSPPGPSGPGRAHRSRSSPAPCASP
jgi:hypothetical protein